MSSDHAVRPIGPPAPGCRADGARCRPRHPGFGRRSRSHRCRRVRHRVRLAAAVRRAAGRDLLAGVLRAVAPGVARRAAGDEGDVVRAADRARSSGRRDRGCSTSAAPPASSSARSTAAATSCSGSTSTRAAIEQAAAAAARRPRSTPARWPIEPFGGERFDAITMIDFIEHVRDPEAELRLAGDRLAAGGRLLISTPRADSAVARATGRHWPQYREEHLTYFSLAGLVGRPPARRPGDRALLRRLARR